jgi:hypothetical protein
MRKKGVEKPEKVEKVVSFPKVKRVRGSKTLVRDTETNAIIETDKGAYSIYMKQKQFKENVASRIEANEKDIKNIKKDLTAIKDLLTTIVEKLNA